MTATIETTAPPLELTDALVEEVRDAVAAGSSDLVAALTGSLHAADLADLLQRLNREERVAVIGALGTAFDPETVAHLDEFVRDQVLEVLGPAAAGEMLAQLETDDAVEILADFDEAQQAEILAALPLPEREAIEQGLAFPEWSAGRLMQREVVAVPDYWTVGQAIDFLRAKPDLPDDFYDIFLVDPRFRVVGDVPLGRLLRTRRAVPLTEIKYKELRSFSAEADQEEVARAFRRYALVSAPVVDGDGRLLGAVTVDDVVDVIDQEAEDDLLKMGGVSEDDTYVPAVQTSLKRMPWLGVNLFTALLGAFVIAQFEGTIERLVSLATLMPLVAGMGGNAGTQALTVTVRSLAAGELSAGTSWRTIAKELVVGLLNGGTFLVAGAALALLLYGQPLLAAVFGAALLINLVVAAVLGTTIPLLLDRLGQDPAVASSVFLTPVTDALGFFVFLGLATVFLL
ncbi:MAG: magnesium transporter [Geminicoccaceae bacterium]